MAKVSELSGVALDWAVAKCEDKNGVLHDDGITRCIVVSAPSGVYKGTWKPSDNWSQGGPIIYRERYANKPHLDGWLFYSHAEIPYYGPTMLIAAMRCYVVSKLGEEIEIPKELL